MEYEVLLYETTDGACPTREFLEGLTPKVRGKVVRWLVLLEQQGPRLLRPYADVLRGKIRELRVGFGGMQYRLLHFFWGRRVVITHGFVKHTAAVPEAEIARATRAMQDFFRRLEGGEIPR